MAKPRKGAMLESYKQTYGPDRTAPILDLFAAPHKTPRSGQVEALQRIEAAFAAGKRFVILEAPTGCHARGQSILMYGGARKRVEDVKVGDFVMGVEQGTNYGGTARRVLELHHGIGSMVRVVPVKGEPFVVNLDHVLTLKRTNQNGLVKNRRRKDCKDGEVVDVSVRDWMKWSRTKKHLYKLFRPDHVQFIWGQSYIYAIDPYFLGVLLGDGGLTVGTPNVCKPDPEIKQLCEIEAKKWGLRIRQAGDTYYFVGSKKKTNPLVVVLKELKLYHKYSGERFVPASYLFGDGEVRRQVLAGLLDTDGSLSSNCYDYISKSHRLAEDVVFLARSLGLAAYLKPCEKYCQTGAGGIYYRVSISGKTYEIPCRIPRKRASSRQQKKDVLVTGFKVEPVGTDEYFGFTLEGDGRFLLGDFTVTHNSGKSLISITAARKYGKTMICTLTKALQDQYLSDPDFKDYGLKPLKGRGSYRCSSCKGESCSFGNTYHNKKCPAGLDCPYKVAKTQALGGVDANGKMWPRAPIVIANYHAVLANAHSPTQSIGTWPLLVLDEAHELEDMLLDHVSVSFAMSKLHGASRELPEIDVKDVDAWFDWVNSLVEPLRVRRGETSDVKEKDEIDQLLRKISFAGVYRKKEEWVVEKDDKRKSVDLKPVTVASFGHMFFDHGEKILLMSGTVLDAGALCASIGIDPEQAEYISLPCTFPAENRPIRIFDLDMRFNARDESWPVMVDVVREILSFHQQHKGLILAPSTAMLQYIHAKLGRPLNSRLLLAFGNGRERMLAQHFKSPMPTVLCASGMWEGLDLYEDRSRFQIICALPRPYWGSAQVQARAKLDYWWYDWKTICKTVQGIGRSIRSDTDSAVTYVLDSAFRAQCERKHNRLVPKWMVDAVMKREGEAST